MNRITLTLNDEERTALIILAEKEFRDPRAQAALIIHKELERQGLIVITNPPAADKVELSQNGVREHDNTKPS